MNKKLKKSGNKIMRKLSRASQKASKKSKAHIKKHIFARAANIKEVRLWLLEWSLLVFAIILFATIQQIWSSNSYESEVFVSGGTYTEATLGAINSMNPIYASTNSEKTLAKLLFSSLLSVDASGKLGNELAHSIKVDESGKRWTVVLREALSWSDGAKLSVEDVIFSFEIIKNPSTKSALSAGLASVKVKQLDDNSLEFTLPVVYPAFPAFLDFPIIPKHILGEVDPALIYENAFSKNPIGSGPFVLNATQVSSHGRTVYLNKNTNYFKGKALLSTFSIRTYETTDQIVDAINRSEVTATADLSDVVDPQINNKAFYKKEAPTNSGVFAFLNTNSEFLSNVKLRQALRGSINTEHLREDIFGQSTLEYPFIEQQITLKLPKIAKLNNQELQQLFKDAGYVMEGAKMLDADGRQLTLQLVALSSGHMAELASWVEQQFSSAGIAVETLLYDNSTAKEFFTSVIQPRAYDILLYELDLGLDPDLFAHYHSSQISFKGLNFSNYKNPLVDDLLLSARSTFNTSLRVAKYESFLNYWVNDVPAIGLYRRNLSYYFNYGARSFSENNTLSNNYDRFSDVLYWAAEKGTRNRTP